MAKSRVAILRTPKDPGIEATGKLIRGVLYDVSQEGMRELNVMESVPQ